MSDSHTMIYQESIDGDQIEVTVPWGFHSGRIPPPIIEFFRSDGQRDLRYFYAGDKS